MFMSSLSLVLALMAVGGYGSGYTVNFQLPPTVKLWKKTQINYTYTATLGTHNTGLSLLLLQTNATGQDLISSSNTATVVIVQQGK